MGQRRPDVELGENLVPDFSIQFQWNQTQGSSSKVVQEPELDGNVFLNPGPDPTQGHRVF